MSLGPKLRFMADCHASMVAFQITDLMSLLTLLLVLVLLLCVGATSSKNLRLSRFKLDRDEI